MMKGHLNQAHTCQSLDLKSWDMDTKFPGVCVLSLNTDNVAICHTLHGNMCYHPLRFYFISRPYFAHHRQVGVLYMTVALTASVSFSEVPPTPAASSCMLS